MHKPSISILAKGASVSILGRLIGGFIELLNQVIFARLLGVELFGLFSIGWGLLRLLQLLSPLGVDKAIIRFGSPHYGTESRLLNFILRDASVFVIFSALATGLLLFVLAPWLAESIFGKPALLIVIQSFAIMLPFASISRVAAISINVSKKMHHSVITEEIVQPAVTLTVFLLAYCLGGGLVGALIAAGFSFLASSCLALYYTRKIHGNFWSQASGPYQASSNYNRRDFIKFSLATFLAGTFMILCNRIDRLIVGSMLSAAETGIYQAASQLCMFVPLVLAGFGATITPVIATLYYQNKKDELLDLYIISTKWGLYLTTPVILAIAFIPDVAISALFGPDYRSGSSALVIMLVGQFISLLTGAVTPILIMTGHQRFWLICSIIALMVNVSMTLILTSRWGLVGAATANTLSIAILYLSGMLYIKNTLGLSPFDKRYFKGIAATVLTALLLWIMTYCEFQHDILQLMVFILIAAGAFLACLLVSGLDSEDQRLLRRLVNFLGLKQLVRF